MVQVTKSYYTGLHIVVKPGLHIAVMVVKPGFHYTANVTTTTQKQSDYKVEQSSFTLIALFSLKICRCRGRNWLNGNQA